MKYVKIFICIMMIFNVTFNFTEVYGDTISSANIQVGTTFWQSIKDIFVGSNSQANATSGQSFLDSIISKANSFLTGASDVKGSGTDPVDTGVGANIRDFLLNSIVPLIENIGVLVFYVVAAFLGVKYIWAGLNGKVEVKETLPTFVVGVVFFFASSKIYTLFMNSVKKITAASNFNTMQGNIWATVSVVVNIFAFAGICAIGLKYMFASADEKADIKKALIPMTIGIVLVYATASVIAFIANSGNGIFTL